MNSRTFSAETGNRVSNPGWIRAGAILLWLWALMLPATAIASASDWTIAGWHLVAEISATGGVTTRLTACRGACAEPGPPEYRVAFRGDRQSVLALTAPGNPALQEQLAALRFHRDLTRKQIDGTELVLRSERLNRDTRVLLRYRIPEEGRRLQVEVDLKGAGAKAFAERGDLSLRLSTGSAFGRSGAVGFTGWFESARTVALVDGDWDTLNAEPEKAAEWAGIRNRFWAVLARSETPLDARAGDSGNGSRTVHLPLSGPGPYRLELYAGPVDPRLMQSGDAGLAGLWLSGLWNWLRALSLGLLYLFDALYRLLGNHGLALMGLALAVKTLMLPLTLLAGRWQREVNDTQSQLAPDLARIRARFRGEARTKRILALHRRRGVRPYYPMKSALAVLIQIPVFIAAFDMLLHEPALAGVPFLWIEDLARPDRFMALPAALPFFGAYLHLLPFLMTGVNLMSARVHGADSPDPGQRQRQRSQLYFMAAAFFLLFYTFPAAMVLYWTCTNAVHLVGGLAKRYYSHVRNQVSAAE